MCTAPAVYLQTTGFLTPGFPCMGAWISYGLGSLNNNLPTFVVLPGFTWTALQRQRLFLLRFSAGHAFRARSSTPPPQIQSQICFPPAHGKIITKKSEADGLGLLKKLNQRTSGAPSRVIPASTPASLRMSWPPALQLSAPEALDLSGETERLKKCTASMTKRPRTSAGTASPPGGCWNAGVRFVQVWSGRG